MMNNNNNPPRESAFFSSGNPLARASSFILGHAQPQHKNIPVASSISSSSSSESHDYLGENVLRIYYKDPIKISSEIMSSDEIREGPTFINKTFEEVHLFSPFEQPYPIQPEAARSPASMVSPLSVGSPATPLSPSSPFSSAPSSPVDKKGKQVLNTNNNNDFPSGTQHDLDNDNASEYNDSDDEDNGLDVEETGKTNEEDNQSLDNHRHLRRAIVKLVKSAALDNESGSPLVAFHSLLYKRLQILDHVQSLQHVTSIEYKKLKLQFEGRPLYARVQRREENINLIRSLNKAMQRSDVKKGLFSKLRKSRSDTLYKLLAKYTFPLSMPGEDVSLLRDYLFNYSVNKENPRKRRAKSVSSLLMIALSQGSLRDMILVLHALLSFSTTSDPLSTDITEEGGVLVKIELLNSLKRLETIVNELAPNTANQKASTSSEPNISQFNPYDILTSTDYAIPISPKRPTSVRQLFMFILATLDRLACANIQQSSTASSALRRQQQQGNKAINIHFCVEALPESFESLISLLEKLLSVGIGTGHFPDENTKNAEIHARMYCIIAILRLLRVNIENVTLWRREDESIEAFVERLTRANNTQSVSSSSAIDITGHRGSFIAGMRGRSDSISSTISHNSAPTPPLGFGISSSIDGPNFVAKLKNYLLHVLEDPTDQSKKRKTFAQSVQKSAQVSKQQGKHKEESSVQSAKEESLLDTVPEMVSYDKPAEVSQAGSRPACETDISDISFGINDTVAYHRSLAPDEIEVGSEDDDYVIITRTKSDLHSPYPLPEGQLRCICHEVSSILCAGFTLFYPTHKEQMEFILDSLNLSHLPLKRTILLHVLRKLVDDPSLFDVFMIQGVGVRESSSVSFIDKLVSFSTEQTRMQIDRLSSTTIASDQQLPGDAADSDDEVSQLCLRLVLMWQNYLFKAVAAEKLNRSPPTRAARKTLLEYSASAFRMCNEILVTASALVPEIASRDGKQPNIIEDVLRRSVVGWVMFPLLLGMIKLLWRNPYGPTANNNPQEREIYDDICSMLVPFLSDLIRCINTFSTLMNYKDTVFSWKIVETDHPYQSNTNKQLQVHFDNAIAIIVQFDPRCRTERNLDALKISTVSNDVSSTIQFSGSGDLVPKYPLFASSTNNLVVSFKSNDQRTDWGIRCYFYPIYELPWMYELERFSGWLGGRCATLFLSKISLTHEEKQHAAWLSSRLFSHGLEAPNAEGTNSGLPNQQRLNDFLQDLIHSRGEAAVLVEFMNEHLKHENSFLRPNPAVLFAERAVTAAILKHADLVYTAMRFTFSLTKNQAEGKSNEVMQNEVPRQLVSAWRHGRKFRTWMIHKRQSEQSEYEAIRDVVLSRANFLLQLQSCTWSAPPSSVSDEAQQQDAHNPSVSSLEISESSSASNIKAVWQTYRKWRSRKSDQELEDEYDKNLADISHQILQFVQQQAGPHDGALEALYPLLKTRTERALNRAKAFKILTDLLNCTKFSSIKADVINGMTDILRSRSMKSAERGSLDFHYFNNTEGCDSAAFQMLCDNFQDFIKSLLRSVPLSSLNESDYEILSGFTREALNTIFFSFRPSDVEWILQFDLLSMLCPLMYNSKTTERKAQGLDDQLHQKEAIVEAPKDLNKKSWEIFRMMATRCVQMLEQWDMGGKHKARSTERDQVRDNLELLRDRIFGMLFDELEAIVRDNVYVPSIIEEMLNLMNSLCRSESAQRCLSTARFQNLLLPLLKMRIPRVQELALQLCGQLILGESRTSNQSELLESEPTENPHLNVLFEFLGAFELRRVLGLDAARSDGAEGGDINALPVGLLMAKKIFLLLRKLFGTSSGKQWNQMIRSMVDESIRSSCSILSSNAEDSKATAALFSDNQMTCLKRVLAAFTLIVGFSYIPMQGDKVQVLLNGKWERATVTSQQAANHHIKVRLEKAVGKASVKVPSETVRVLTQEPLDKSLYEMDETSFIALCQFSDLCAERLFSSASSKNAKYMYSFMWMKTLEVLKVWASGSSAVHQFFDEARMSRILEFAMMRTPIKYGKELKIDSCTYLFTGRMFTKQYYHPCNTCGMVSNKAVCIFCARLCHRGHSLGPAEVGDFYCDCGAGDCKHSCRSLKHAPPDPITTPERLESLTLRLQELIPLFIDMYDKAAKSSAAQTSVINNASRPTRFVLGKNERTGYAISPQSGAISFTWSSATGFSMLGTDSPISYASVPSVDGFHGFYFEVEIVDMGRPKGVAIGLAETINTNAGWPDVLQGSYTFHPNTGHLLRGTAIHKQYFGPICKNGDVVGCGWSKEYDAIFFTLNGEMMGGPGSVAFTNVAAAGAADKKFYPVIVLRGDQASVRPNLGSQPFKFKLCDAFRPEIQLHAGQFSNGDRAATSTAFLGQAARRDSDEQTARRLAHDIHITFGFTYDQCLQALRQTGFDPNAAAAWLFKNHRSAGSVKPLRQQLADNLQDMGFTNRDLVLRALKLNQDDLNLALNWMLEQAATPGATAEDGPEEADEGEERGTAFLGSNITPAATEELLMISMLENPDITPINDNMFTDVQLDKLEADNLVVIDAQGDDHQLGGSGSSQSAFPKMRGRLGTVVKKAVNGAWVRLIDPSNGSVLSSFVGEKNMQTPPPELRNLRVANILDEASEYYRALGILYARRILYYFYANWPAKSVVLDSTKFTKDFLFKSLKLMFLPHYHDQQPNFLSKQPELSKDLETLTNNIGEIQVSSSLGTLPLCEYISDEVITREMSQFAELCPHIRKEMYKNEYNNRKVPVRFWGASALLITFSALCELPAPTDTLSFYADGQGKKKIKEIKGQVVAQNFPRNMVITGDKFWFEFKIANLQGLSHTFQFYITPLRYRIDEGLALTQPNLAFAAWVFKASIEATNPIPNYAINNAAAIAHKFEAGLKHIMTPFAPFKGSFCDALSLLCTSIEKLPLNKRPSLAPLKRFRLELEDMYLALRKKEAEIAFSQTFHLYTEFMSRMRKLLVSELCSSLLRPETQQPSKEHMYTIREGAFQQKVIKCCTACVQTSASTAPPRYLGLEAARCSCPQSKTKQFQYYDNIDLDDSKSSSSGTDDSNLVPFKRLVDSNPSDWFEHVGWMDQIAIVREVLDCFAYNKPLPEWFLYEAILETKKRVIHKESPHPYTILNDAGEVSIPNAKTLNIAFDKHSKTHKCDRLFFGRTPGSDDIGSFGGDELKDKAIIVHGTKVYYTFKCVGGDHECTCNSCGTRIHGVRHHCTQCDDYDLCEKCIKKPHVHNDRHLFLKIRRPVDCVPAALPPLYTNRWTTTAQYRGNVHVGVKCNACGISPIRGPRYWCENCEDFNLCEKCSLEEYRYHDRMHVFLRVTRPLPPKHQLPPNALPYGLVYEKDLDTHWGYLFSVSSADSGCKYDEQVASQIEEVRAAMSEWDKAADAQLVQYVENCCNGWQSLEPDGLKPNRNQLLHYPLLSNMSLKSLRYRFIVLKLLNRKLSRIIHMCDLSDCDKRPGSLSWMIAEQRERIFRSVKMDVWTSTLEMQHHPSFSNPAQQPVNIKLNRHKVTEVIQDPSADREKRSLSSLFYQAFKQVHATYPRVLCRKNGAWKVTFVGEASDDYGGPYRESITQICSELQQQDLLPLLIQAPNGQHSVGLNREKFMPRPSACTPRYMDWYHFMGVLMAVALLSKLVIPLDLPALFWKPIVKEPIVPTDLEAIDQMTYQSLQSLRTIEKQGVTEEQFQDVIYETFSTHNAEGTEVELVKGGKNIRVDFHNRFEYADLVQNYRLHECQLQVEQIRKGMYSLINPRYFPLFTWREMELLICGTPDIDINILKKHTIYEGYTANSREIRDFWSVIESMTPQERSLYLRFVWGRSRLPVSEEGFGHPMKIQKLDRPKPDEFLPLSHTCFFSLELPAYSSRKVMRDRLLYAITNCQAIDTDFTTNAQTARNAAWVDDEDDEDASG